MPLIESQPGQENNEKRGFLPESVVRLMLWLQKIIAHSDEKLKGIFADRIDTQLREQGLFNKVTCQISLEKRPEGQNQFKAILKLTQWGVAQDLTSLQDLVERLFDQFGLKYEINKLGSGQQVIIIGYDD